MVLKVPLDKVRLAAGLLIADHAIDVVPAAQDGTPEEFSCKKLVPELFPASSAQLVQAPAANVAQ